MATPRPRSVRRPVGRPQLVPHGTEIPSAKEQMAAAERRLEASGRAEEGREARKAAERRLDPKDPEGIERVIANQEEILRRLSAHDSILTKIAQRVEDVPRLVNDWFDDKEVTASPGVTVAPVPEIPTVKAEASEAVSPAPVVPAPTSAPAVAPAPENETPAPAEVPPTPEAG